MTPNAARLDDLLQQAEVQATIPDTQHRPLVVKTSAQVLHKMYKAMLILRTCMASHKLFSDVFGTLVYDSIRQYLVMYIYNQSSVYRATTPAVSKTRVTQHVTDSNHMKE